MSRGYPYADNYPYQYQCMTAHPGEVIKRLLWHHKPITQKALAEKLDMSVYRLGTLLKGTVPIDVSTALKLSYVFPEYSAYEWLDMQIRYELHQASESGMMQAMADRLSEASKEEDDDAIRAQTEAYIINNGMNLMLDKIIEFILEELPYILEQRPPRLDLHILKKIKLHNQWDKKTEFWKKMCGDCVRGHLYNLNKYYGDK